MDYYLKKAVEVVKRRRRSREEVEEEVSVEQNLHLAAKNCVVNVDPARKDSITSEDLESLSVLEKPPRRMSANV